MDLSNSQSKKLRSQCDGSCSTYTDSSETSRRSVHHHHVHDVHERHTQSSASSSSITFSQRELNANFLGTHQIVENNGVNMSERQMDQLHYKSYLQQQQFHSIQRRSYASPSLHNHQEINETTDNNYNGGSTRVGDAAMNLSCRVESQVTTDGFGLDTDSEGEDYEIRTAKLTTLGRREQQVKVWSRWSWVERSLRRIRDLVLSLFLSVLTFFYKGALLATVADLWILSRASNLATVRFFRDHSLFALLLLLLLPFLFLAAELRSEMEDSVPFINLLNSSSSFFISIANSALYIFNSQNQKSVQTEEVRWSPSSIANEEHSRSETLDRSSSQVQHELERMRRDIDALFRLLEEQKRLTKEKTSGESTKAVEEAVVLLKSQMFALEKVQREMETRMTDSNNQHSQLRASVDSLHSAGTVGTEKANETDREQWIRTILIKLFEEESEDEIMSKLMARLKKIFVTREEFFSFVSLSLELKQSLSELKSEQTKVVSGSYSEEEMLRVIRRELALYDADQLGLVDYALESSGGSVVSTRCSETYNRYSAQIYMWGIPVWKETASPRLIIQPSRQPGECWPFVGSEGYVVIKLSRAVIPTAFSLDHVPRSISPDNSLRSAPNHFSVWGLKDEMGPGLLLGKYNYDDKGHPLQTFAVQEENSEVFNLIELKIHSNHGHPEFTCVYRFRVHGVPQL